MDPATAGVAGVNQAGPYALAGWIASDMDTTVLENGCGLYRFPYFVEI